MEIEKGMVTRLTYHYAAILRGEKMSRAKKEQKGADKEVKAKEKKLRRQQIAQQIINHKWFGPLVSTKDDEMRKIYQEFFIPSVFLEFVNPATYGERLRTRRIQLAEESLQTRKNELKWEIAKFEKKVEQIHARQLQIQKKKSKVENNSIELKNVEQEETRILEESAKVEKELAVAKESFRMLEKNVPHLSYSHKKILHTNLASTEHIFQNLRAVILIWILFIYTGLLGNIVAPRNT